MNQREVAQWLTERVSTFTGIAPEQIDHDRPFQEFGLSSREALQLVGELEDELDQPLSATLLWDHGTISAVSAAVTADACPVEEPAASTDAGEPIAVVGLGCRLPGGAHGPDALWRLLRNGTDAVSEVPAERWSQFAGGSPRELDALARIPRSAGVLEDISGFDAEFFGISPGEAAGMDPQQRLLLETAWEALEHAAISPAALRGSRTGVFVGVSGTDYGQLTLSDVAGVDAWTGTGAALSITANRLSYALDLRGPSMAVDTACSSSLVAVHLAVRSLRAGESSLALAGGANLVLGPGVTANFERMGILSARGRCASFDASADGIVRGEGAGVVVLKRLSDAVRDNDRVLAVIRGSAINQDGRSNGLTGPNPQAQQELIRTACADAGVVAAQVDYVEAHGTGTPLGDPIEAGALGAVYGASRPADRPLLTGSIKSNLGHLEAAAGVAGLIKVVLSLRHNMIPASLHYERPSPHIPFADLRLAVAAHATPWPSAHRRAAVSAFGFGGTNAHIVLEQAPEAVTPAIAPTAVHDFLLTAPNDDRLREQAGVLADWAAGPGAGTAVQEVATTLLRRATGPAKAAVIARDHAGLISGLRAVRDGIADPHVRTAPDWAPQDGQRGVVWVFSGQGGQWAGMGQRLLADEPAFAAAVAGLDPLFRRLAGLSLLEEISLGAEQSSIDRIQPVLFGLQVALGRFFLASGARPAAVIGHSFGEVAAAVLAGAVTVEQGLRIVTERSRLLATVAGSGAMAVLGLSAKELLALVEHYPGVEAVVFNAPAQTVAVGPVAEVGALVERVAEDDLLAKLIKVDVAAHSAMVEPVTGALRAALSGLTGRTPEIPFYTTVLDDPRASTDFDADYWAANLRRPVRFTQAVSAALEDGFSAFMEISAHPTLTRAITETAETAGRFQTLVASSLSRGPDETVALRGQLAELHLAGVLDRPEQHAEVCDLPGTVWRHKSYWTGSNRPAPVDHGQHPLLGKQIELPGDDRHVWQSDLGLAGLPWLSDHRAGGHPLLPTTGYVEMALNAASVALAVPIERLVLRELILHEPMLLTEHVAVTTVFHEGQVEVHSRAAQGQWTSHATVRAEVVDAVAPTTLELDSGVPVDPAEVYARLRKAGQWHGPAFAGIQAVERTATGLVATVELPPLAGRHPGFLVHPVLLDSCLQVLGASLESSGDNDFYLPMTLGQVRVHALPGESVVCQVRLEGSPGDEGRTGSARLLSHDGGLLVEVDDLFVRRIQRWEPPASVAAHLVETVWTPVPSPERTVAACAVLLVTEDADSPRHAELVTALSANGHQLTELTMCAVLDDPALIADHLAPHVILAATGYAEPGCPDRAGRLVLAAATLARELADARVRLLTFGAAALGQSTDPGPAALRGLVRVLAYEHPELSATWLDLPPDSGAEHLVTELAAGDAEDEVAWRDGIRHAGRLRQVTGLDRASWQPPVRSDGGYVVTGGLGGLGLTVARWLADNGAAKVVLNGRSAPTLATAAALEAMRADGVQVEVVTGDLAEPGTAERLLAAAGSGAVARGVVHAAAVMDPRLTTQLNAELLDRVWSPKAVGAWRLHLATVDLDLDWWLAFSSLSALLGWPGEPAYASANAYLDALAGWRHGTGLAGATIQWGAWAEVGRAAGLELTAVDPITPAEGLGSLGALACSGRTSTGVMKVDFDVLLAAHPELRPRPFFSGMGTGGSARTDSVRWDGVAALPADPRQASELVYAQLRHRIANLMGFTAGQLSPTVALTMMGLDSLLAIRVRNAMRQDFGTAPPIPRLLRGATLAELAGLVTDELGLPAPIEAPPTDSVISYVPPRDDAERLVAAIWEEVLATRCGVTTAFPGDATQRDAVAELLSQRCGLTFAADASTVQDIAALVRAHNGSGDAVRVLRHGESNPVFLFHPGGGDSWVYRHLVELLGPSVPAFGFDRIDGVTSIADRAEHYVARVLRLRPRGPYRLVGWSFGGFLAYEVAHRLVTAGHEVELVGLIDSINPTEPHEAPTGMDEPGLRHLAATLEAVYGQPIPLPYKDMVAADDLRQADLLTQAITEAGVIAEEIAPAILHSQRTFHVEALAVKRYAPPLRVGRTVLYRATQEPPAGAAYPWFDRSDEDLGWSEFCGSGLAVVPVDGHHFAMLDSPQVDTIAAHLRALLG